MEVAITVIHVVVCLFLIVVVLLQAGKGAEVGAVMGGAGSQALFGGGGSGNFLSKLTGWVAFVFMVTSIGLTIVNRSETTSSIMDDVPELPPVTETYSGTATGDTAVTSPVASTLPAEQPLSDVEGAE